MKIKQILFSLWCVLPLLPLFGKEYIQKLSVRVVHKKGNHFQITEEIWVKLDERKFGLSLPFSKSESPEILSVERNGEKEPYWIEQKEWGFILFTGKRGRYLPPKIHHYKITYRANLPIKIQKKNVHLAFDLTRRKWSFPIHQLEGEFLLPQKGGIQVSHSLKISLEIIYQEAGPKHTRLLIRSQKPVLPDQVILLSFQMSYKKGVFDSPSSDKKPWWQHRILKFLLAFFLFSLLFHLGLWFLVGKNPKRGTIVPRYSPPQSLSPSEMRYLWNMGYDGKCLAAFLLHMASKGKIKVTKKENHFEIHFLDPSTENLTPFEKKAWETIWNMLYITDIRLQATEEKMQEISAPWKKLLSFFTSTREKLGLFSKKTNGKTQYILKLRKNRKNPLFNEMGGILLSLLESQYGGGRYFKTNQSLLHFFSLVNMFIFLSFFSIFFADHKEEATGSFIFLFICFMFIYALWPFISRYISIWRQGGRPRLIDAETGCAILILLILMPSLLILLPVFALLPFIGFFFLIKGGGLPLALFVLLIMISFFALHEIFSHLIKAPTEKGQKIIDQIEGFRMYLETAETTEVEVKIQQGKKPFEIANEYLAYAFALDTTNQWLAKFSPVLREAITEGDIDIFSQERDLTEFGESFSSVAPSVGSSNLKDSSTDTSFATDEGSTDNTSSLESDPSTDD